MKPSYKDVQNELRERAKQTRVPLIENRPNIHSGPVKFKPKTGAVLKYSDGSRYVVMPNGEQRRVR